MASQILTDAQLWAGQYDWTGDMNSTRLDYAAEMQAATTFGQTTRINKGGLKTVTLSNEGFFSAGTDEIDAELFATIGTAGVATSVCPGSGVAGEACYLFRAIRANYTPGAQVGEMLRFGTMATAGGGAGLIRGTVLFNGTSTASGNGTKFQVGAVSATQKIYAALHVFSVSAADTLDVVLQSDADASAGGETARITFTQATAATSEWKELAGAVTDTWWRASATVGGSGVSIEWALTVGIL